MTTTTPERLPLTTVMNHALTPIIMGVLMALAYFGGFHNPQPHEVPVAVVGAPDVAGPVSADLQAVLNDKVELSTVPTPEEAESELQHLTLSGAFIPGATSNTLMVASASSESTTQAVERIFRAVSTQQGKILQVKDVAPLNDNDPVGQNAFFYLVALSVTSYACSIAIAAAGSTRRFWERILLGAAAALGISALMTIIASAVFGMFAGHRLAIFGLTWLYSTAVMFFGIGMHPIFKRFSTLVFATCFVGLNFTSSGGVFEPVMQPGFFGWLHDFWIGAGFSEAAKKVMYFPDVTMGAQMSILFGWLVLGVIALVAGYSTERHQHTVEYLRVAVEDGHRQRVEVDSATEEELESDVAV
ncbi:hypothetical protein D3M95_00825 [Corynebacterium falsenii]|uniref:ABC transporter permease n=1 Tax=Corynebacterium falsenii TaxID=108486 RepID=A0A418Q9U5_9CORY|nr:hypothetical protein [Corynebacterium falsenii]RIX36784.1 hypothetical protein D3M95_00825 [Corynebacterium falsenii]